MATHNSKAMRNNAHSASLNATHTSVTAQQTISIQRLPIPQAEELQKLELINPGIAQQFMNMALSEQNHRHNLDNKEDKRKVYSLRWAFASLLILCSLCAMGFYLGYPTQAATIACGVIVTSLIAFIGGSVKKEDSDK